MIPIDEERRAAEVARLNDQLRRTFSGGAVFFTAGVLALPAGPRSQIIEAVRQFSDFNADNDPSGEHDCAVITAGGERIIWKIDCYDLTLEYWSPNPTDPAVTARVLTIMLAAEY